MASNFGVNTITTVNAARPIRINSSTPIGIAASVLLDANVEAEAAILEKLNADDGMLYYGSPDEALEDFKENLGTVRNALDGIADQNVNAPVVLSLVQIDQTQYDAGAPEDTYGDPAVKSAIITAVGNLRKSGAKFGVKPNLIIAPFFSHDLDINAEMKSVADALLATGIVDLNAVDEADVNTQVDNYGTRRLLLCDPYVKVWDTVADAAAYEPSSARIAGMIARTDSEVEYGWADSFSNRVVNGISGSKRDIEFTPGQECEADRLRTKAVTTLIRYNGFRAWGGETTDIDPIWQDLTRVRVFDRVCEAALDGLFWAIDRRADILKSAKDSVEQMLLALKGSSVLLGFNVYWDPEKNTRANITAGKFYMVAEMQNMPIVKRLEVNFSYVDKYADVLIKQIS
ncbi:phage tail sheath subtilisin-like domain-containing protein [Halarcobacter anaerophilus]|uniref:phage tail sheath subtilisin-like domain-containing protein n=1 Tax=Halarcobacter anaerophilus TaxID=877500 RepID=UPI0005C8F28E|nr:phage tail sheath subtilisin-like domain-containing protein [Halarcobacter anaerophilus]